MEDPKNEFLVDYEKIYPERSDESMTKDQLEKAHPGELILNVLKGIWPIALLLIIIWAAYYFFGG